MTEPRLKILIVTGIFPPDSGGPASYVPEISRSLTERGHKITSVVTLSDSLVHNDSKYIFPIKRILRSQNRFIRLIRTLSEIKNLAKSSDIIFLNGLTFEGIIATKFLTRKPIVTKVVGDLIWEHYQHKNKNEITLDEFQRKFTGVKNLLLKKLQSWYINKSDYIITPSQHLKKTVENWKISSEKIIVIYNAIDTESTQTNNTPEKSYDVVCVGRLIPLKKVDSVIRTCKKNKWNLLIIGDGPEMNYLQSQASNLSPTEPKITFLGAVEKGKIIPLIKTATTFVLNSTHEGLPHAILEAMKAGTPVIATKVGGIPEIIDDNVNGILIAPGNDLELENAIKKLLNLPKLRDTIITNSNEQIKNKFNWETLVQKTEEILYSAIEKYNKG